MSLEMLQRRSGINRFVLDSGLQSSSVSELATLHLMFVSVISRLLYQREASNPQISRGVDTEALLSFTSPKQEAQGTQNLQLP